MALRLSVPVLCVVMVMLSEGRSVRVVSGEFAVSFLKVINGYFNATITTEREMSLIKRKGPRHYVDFPPGCKSYKDKTKEVAYKTYI